MLNALRPGLSRLRDFILSLLYSRVTQSLMFVEISFHRSVITKCVVSSLQSVVCSLQSAVCSLQSAVCSLQSAVCSLQSAVCKCQTPTSALSEIVVVDLRSVKRQHWSSFSPLDTQLSCQPVTYFGLFMKYRHSFATILPQFYH